MSWPEFIKDSKDKLNRHESVVDPDAIWNAIEPTVDQINAKKRRRRGFFIWFFLAGALLVGSTVAFLLWEEDSTYSSMETQANQMTSVQSDQQNRLQTATGTSIEASADQSNTIEESEAGANSTLDQEQASVPSTNARNTSTASKSTEVATKQTTSTHQNSIASNNTTQQRNRAVDGESDSRPTPEAKTAVAVNKFHSNNNRTAIRNEVKEANSAAQTNDDVVRTSERRMAVQPLPGQLVSVQTSPNDLQLNPSLTISPPAAKRSKRQQNNDAAFSLGIGVVGGLGYSPKSLSTDQSNLQSMVDLREDTETTLETSQMGLALTVSHMSGIELTLGVNRTRMVERFNYQSTAMQTVTEEGIQYYSVTLSGDTIAVMGEVDVKQTTNINKEYYNRYTSIELPVILGYRFGKNNWTTAVRAGVISNLSFKTSGLIANGENDFIDIEEDQDDVFKSNLGLGLYFGASIGYMLTPSLELSLAPYYRTYGETITVADYGIDQKHSTIGANLGLTYWLGK